VVDSGAAPVFDGVRPVSTESVGSDVEVDVQAEAANAHTVTATISSRRGDACLLELPAASDVGSRALRIGCQPSRSDWDIVGFSLADRRPHRLSPQCRSCSSVMFRVMKPLSVLGLDHIVVRCADVERSLAFYCGSLGLGPERVEDWRSGMVPFPSVRITPTTIIDLFGSAPTGTNMDHVCLVIAPADLEEIASSFPGARLGDHLFGAQGYASSVYIPDPDGNTIELRSYEPFPAGTEP
jgi:catechol 2,3-dioxygenase-like lactoylglutathione lyase family enzyme